MLGYADNPVFYVISLSGTDRPVKVGKDETWPSRYVQARCHSPVGVNVAATFAPLTGKVTGYDSGVRKRLRSYRLATRACEWYTLSIDQAIAELSLELTTFKLHRHPNIQMRPEHLRYDDWRECRASYMRYAWRIFVHREEGTGRLKLSYGALYDTHYLYCATYNWRRLHLVAGFEHVNRQRGNSLVQDAWRNIVSDSKFGRGLDATAVGWLSEGATLSNILDFLRPCGLVEFDLARAKPVDAPRKDASMNKKFFEYGAVPNQDWVKQLP